MEFGQGKRCSIGEPLAQAYCIELELGMRLGVVDESSNVAGALRLPSPRGLAQTTVALESVHRLQE